MTMTRKFRTFSEAIDDISYHLMTAKHKIRRGKWQGVDVSKRPDFSAHELLYYSFMVPLATEDPTILAADINPNLPWADDHFLERISHQPLNPGEEWRNWPWNRNADKFRHPPKSWGDPGHQPIFDHTYMQRYWPKHAGKHPDGRINHPTQPHRGIYFDYGDLADVVNELVDDPTTRQAILPVFFPEDTGLRPGRRKPCSLAYQFHLDNGHLDIVYFMRSCEYARFLRDDIYLTARLLVWVTQEVRKLGSAPHHSITVGNLVMFITNLHIFDADWMMKWGR